MESGITFFLHDHQGSVRCIADSSGRIIKRLDYTPFGIPQQPLTSDELQPGFAGLFYDPAVGLYITRARTYDPQTGRFLQIDPQHRIPLGSPKDLSPYTYCGGDPVNYIDQTGFQPQSPLVPPGIQLFNQSLRRLALCKLGTKGNAGIFRKSKV